MTAEARWIAVALGSLVLWSPALRQVLSGDLPLAHGLFRYALALVVATVAVSWFDRLLAGYRLAAARRAALAAIEAHAQGAPRRRRDDPPGDEGPGSRGEAATA